MKFLRSSKAWFLALVAATAPVHAQQAPSGGRMNPNNALSRTVVPLASIFSPQSSQHGLTATLVLESMTGLPPELVGASVDLALQPPDRLLVRGPFGGEITTVCRVGQEVWITPGSKFQALATTPPPPENEPSKKAKKKKKKKSRSKGLAPMALPFPPEQLALLPIIFRVSDAGEEAGLRLIDVRLIPELAQGLGVEEWTARLFLAGRSSEPRIAKIELSRPGWQLVVRVERVELLPELPASTWEPASPDLLRLTAPQAIQWFQTLADQTIGFATPPK